MSVLDSCIIKFNMFTINLYNLVNCLICFGKTKSYITLIKLGCL